MRIARKKTSIAFSFLLIGGVFFASCGGSDQKEVESEEKKKKAKASKTSVNYTVNRDKSVLHWSGSNALHTNKGTIDIKSGHLKVKGNEIQAGEFTIDMTSIDVKQPKDKEDNKKLQKHLKSPDFFHVDSLPTGKFVLTGVKEKAGVRTIEKDLDGDDHADTVMVKRTDKDGKGGTYTHLVEGNLTLYGNTRNIEFPANIKMKDGRVMAKADFKINRHDWGISYLSKESLGGWKDKAIHNLIGLKIDLTAEKKAS